MTRPRRLLLLAVLTVGIGAFVIWWITNAGAGGPTGPGGADAAPSTAGARSVGPRESASGAAEPSDAGPAPGRQVAVDDANDLTIRGGFVAEGVPVEGVELTIEAFEGLRAGDVPVLSTEVVTDARGEFTWRTERPNDATWFVRARAESERAKSFCDGAVALPGQTEVRVEVTGFVLSCAVTGRVSSAVDGTPVGGCHVSQNGWHWVRADADGRYAINACAGSYSLLFSADGFVDRLIDTQITADQEQLAVDVTLRTARGLDGRVIDASRSPVAGAAVRSGGSLRRTESDVEGRFTLWLDGDSEYVQVLARKAGFAPAERIWELGAGDVEVVMTRGATLIGVVVSAASGAPIAGARVELIHPQSGRLNTVFCGADGRFVLDDLATGPRTVHVRAAGFVGVRASVEVDGDGDPLELALETGHELRGLVVDSDDRPIAGAWVSASATAEGSGALAVRGESGADGRVVLEGVPAQTSRVRASKSGFRPASADDVVPGGGGGDALDVTLRLERALRVAGRVVDAETGAPIPAFAVRAGVGEDYYSMAKRSVNDPDGRFEVTNPRWTAGRTLRTEIRSAGYALGFVELRADLAPEPDDTVIALHRGVTIQGFVLDGAAGAPVAGAFVELLSDGDPRQFGAPRAKTQTDAAGRFEFVDVAAGRARISVVADGYPRATPEGFEVARGPGRHDVTVELAGGVAFSGRLVGFGPIDQVTLREYAGAGRTQRGTPAADGSFRFDGVAPGLHELGVVLPDGDPTFPSQSTWVDVAASGD